MNEIEENGIIKNKIHNPKNSGVTKKYWSEILSNLNNFFFHHKRRKIKEAREYISEVHKWIQYIKEYYSHQTTLHKITTKLSEAYDEYSTHFVAKWISKEEYITKTMSHLKEWLKNIQCYFVNKNSRRISTKDRDFVAGHFKKTIGYINSESKYGYILNNKAAKWLVSLYWKQFIQSAAVHELDHYIQQLLFNDLENYPVSEIEKIVNQKPYDEEKVNPLYLYLQEETQWLFRNRMTIYEKLLRKEVEKQKKDPNYELNLLEILSRIRQLKLARLRTLDDELNLESIKDDDLSSDPTKNMYAWEILSQIVDKNKFLEFVNSIR